MDWQLATAISIMANVITTLIQRGYSKVSTAPATYPTAASYLFGVMPIGLLAGLLIFPHHIKWSTWLVSLIVIQGIAMAISGWTGFKAAGQMSVAPMQTINRLSQITVVILGWSLLSERLSHYQLIGATVILIAAIAAAWAPKDRKIRLTKKSTLLSASSAIALGIGLVCEKAMLNHVEIGAIFLIAWGGQTISMIILASFNFSKKAVSNFYKHELVYSTKMGLANGFSGVFYVYAIKHSDSVSLIQSLAAVSLPLTVMGAHFLLKEKDSTKLVWASVGLSTVGLVIMSL